MLKIVTIPNPILTQPTKKVDRFDESLKKIVKQMEETLVIQTNPQGVGLAAPQVGINTAIFIIKPSQNAKTEVFVNPRIIHTSEVKNKAKTKLEGCLSVPKIWSSVERNKKIQFEYQDINGKLHKKWLSGFKGVIIQHEVDHINGILFTQRALEQNQQLYEEKEGKLKKMQSVV